MEVLQKQAAVLANMTGLGRGVIAESLLSRLASIDPPAAELFGSLIGAFQNHDANSLPLLGKELRELASQTPRRDLEVRRAVDVLVVAPKRIEEDAVLAAFGTTRVGRVQTEASRYPGYLTSVEGRTVLICSPQTDGNVKMALFVSEWLREWIPKLGALIGMAGGREGEVEPGDLVLATDILDYQIVRRIATPTGSVDKNRFVSYTSHDNLRTNFLTGDDPTWIDQMKIACAVAMSTVPKDKQLTARQFRAWRPSLKKGVILAGSTLVEDGTIGKIADDIHDRAMAVEMEGAGFAGAMHAALVPWLSIRGIADMGGHPGYAEPDGKLRTKKWQFVSAFAAAHRLRMGLPDISVL